MKTVKNLKIGDIVVQIYNGRSTEYKIIEIRNLQHPDILGFIGEIDNGSSVALVGFPDNNYLNVGSDWYSANYHSDSSFFIKE